jgi:5'-deoxynucleotidase YfbR-like HD superfamily hydrolase
MARGKSPGLKAPGLFLFYDRSMLDVERFLDRYAELHTLTRLPRVGWICAGVADPEHVSDHCFEAALVAYGVWASTSGTASSDYAGVDIGKALVMLMLHDAAEARLGEVPRRGQRYVQRHISDHATARAEIDILDGVDQETLDVLEEYAAGETYTARFAKACHELQILCAALMYARANNGDMTEYVIDSAQYESGGFPQLDEIARHIHLRIADYTKGQSEWHMGKHTAR